MSVETQHATFFGNLPPVRGRMRLGADLSKSTWFQVGGPAELLFRPENTDDLSLFLRHAPAGMPVSVLGVGSNLLVRDGGIEGAVIRLGRVFAEVTREEDAIVAGAGALSLNVAEYAVASGLEGLAFLSGIPGTVGGAVAMNAGAYGSESKDRLLKVECVLPGGEVVCVPASELRMTYRHAELPHGAILTRAWFRAIPGDASQVAEEMARIRAEREASQPVRSRTGGSTFKNPAGHKAWELIDRAGCRGRMLGGAQVSEKHCNFLINTGDATAADLEMLGEEVRERVHAETGIMLEWEIKRVGFPAGANPQTGEVRAA